MEDRWYERAGGADAAGPVTIVCPLCEAKLSDHLALASHLGAAHPLSAPRLLIGRDVVVRERVLHRRGDAARLSLANTTKLLVAQDGGEPRPWSLGALQDFVAEARRALLVLTLHNDRGVGPAGEPERVELRIDVPDEADLAGVDAAFAALAAGELDEHAADAFLDAASEFCSGARYASALHEYVVGVLVKDRGPGTGAALAFERFHGKYNRALDVLRHFPERPVARAVTGFLRFNFNEFRGTSGVPVLDGCAARLAAVAGRPEAVSPPLVGETAVGRCPADATTGDILDAWERQDATALLERADAALTTPADAAKCRALALDLAGPADQRLLRAAHSLTGDLMFGRWAAAIVEDAAA